VTSQSETSKSLLILTKIGAHPTNKRNKVSDDSPDAGKPDGMLNERKAIKTLTGGRGAMSLEGRRGSGRGRGRGGGRGGGRGRGK
jgi:regulator of ribosome biosynthesis